MARKADSTPQKQPAPKVAFCVVISRPSREGRGSLRRYCWFLPWCRRLACMAEEQASRLHHGQQNRGEGKGTSLTLQCRRLDGRRRCARVEWALRAFFLWPVGSRTKGEGTMS